MKKIYISPSNQYNNVYADGIHNEKEVMETIAFKLVERLKKYEVDVIMRTNEQKIPELRMAEANALGVDYYLVLHSNAYNHIDGRGCETYYMIGTDNKISVNALSKAFATKINAEISAITDTNPLAGDRGIKARQQGNGQDWLMELRLCNMPAAYSELEFHDTQVGCQWIITHMDEAADAYCRAVVSQMGLPLRQVLPPAPTPTSSALAVGNRIAFQPWALKYATGQWLPRYVRNSQYTVQELFPKVNPTKALLNEIQSWVFVRDIRKV
jgi:hypothetical protein